MDIKNNDDDDDGDGDGGDDDDDDEKIWRKIIMLKTEIWHGGGSGKRSPHKQAVASGFESSDPSHVVEFYSWYQYFNSMVFLKKYFGGLAPMAPFDLPLIRSTLELLLLIIESYNYICI